MTKLGARTRAHAIAILLGSAADKPVSHLKLAG
jgi:hypothetical protein